MDDSRLWIGTAALLLSCCATAGGSHAPLASTVTAADYVPLNLGASWTYEVSYPGQVGEMTVTLVGEKDGFTLDNHNGAFRLTQDGLRDRDRYLIQHPVVAGTKWRAVVGASAVEQYEIVSAGESCQAVAGSFADCLVVLAQIRRDANMALRLRWTWAKGVGLVKLESEAEVAGKGVIPQVKQSLKHYALKGEVPPAVSAPAKGATPAPAPPKKTKKDDDAPGGWEKTD